MKNKMLKSIRSIVTENFKFWEVIILMGLTAVIGLSLGGVIVKHNNILIAPEQNSDNLQEFVNNYNNILNNYYGDVDEEKVLDKALEAILTELGDPYAAYMDELESSNFEIYLKGSYKGIGVEVATLNKTKELIITNVFPNSPASKAGLQVGDIVLMLNHESLAGVTSSDFAAKIKSLKNNFVLTVLREKEELDFEVALEVITLESVSYKMLENNIGYINISIFADNTYNQLKESLQLLNADGMQSLIIDLRDNTGGYLASVDKILGLFLDSSNVIYQIQDKNGIKKYYSDGDKNFNHKIILLTNENTASASEIMTAALKENINAISVGKKTYGKGSAQQLHSTSNGSKYKFTTQKWLTPLGNSIDKIGVDVDYEVELNESYYDNPSLENDNQLQYAIELLEKSKI